MRFKLNYLYRVALWSSVFGIILIVLDFGFPHSIEIQKTVDFLYFVIITLGIASTFARYFDNRLLFKRKVFIFDLLSVLYTIFVFYYYLLNDSSYTAELVLSNPFWIISAVILSFIREISEVNITYKRTYLNPAQLFIASFVSIILIGALLLMLPKATVGGLSFIDALFTSTSAVCVTGLAVVDTGTYFTTFGQSIILVLIQIGGLGILTFASYFSYFFKGGTTYENQLSLSEMINSQKLSDVFSTLKYIILITVIIELTAATMIFFTLESHVITSVSDKIYFSIFHSVSSFCNAGFSTLSNSVYDTEFRFNYGFQLVLILTFILGGLGFPIVVNILKYLKHKISTIITFGRNKIIYKPWVLHLNSRITLITTLSITLVAFTAFFFIEYNNTLKDHSFFGKMVTALFEAATPRTAGFNSVDMQELTLPTVMITLLLMWIGASPASTGGGIKTSTFAIATLNIISLARGKSRIEIFRREIDDLSVKRAFATISLSLMVIGIGIVLISIFDGDKGLLNIAFEGFSAYSTVGLSLGITADLSSASKFVLIVIMFVGRVSMLSIMVAMFKKVKHKNYRYPSEQITIN